MKYAVIGIFGTLLVVMLLAVACEPTGQAVLTPLDSTMERIAELDQKYGISLHDYDDSVAHIKYNPRYPNPLNVADFDPIIQDFADLALELEPGSYERTIVEARIDLLEAEKFYKMATKTKKGLVDDGFRCSEGIYVQAATLNFRSCVTYGRSAVEKYSYLVENHYNLTDKTLDIRRYWVNSLNESFDEIESYSRKNKKTFEKLCNVTIS
ncbi:hypothetical protein GF345_05285 [Candidatus Woesearchaeota archaeon]|nr:hypothetical protein [Candidatus Woesearchaeota archaeon]